MSFYFYLGSPAGRPPVARVFGVPLSLGPSDLRDAPDPPTTHTRSRPRAPLRPTPDCRRGPQDFVRTSGPGSANRGKETPSTVQDKNQSVTTTKKLNTYDDETVKYPHLLCKLRIFVSFCFVKLSSNDWGPWERLRPHLESRGGPRVFL